MFVAELDRPWEGTPFLLQGFLVEDDNEQAKLADLCEYVVVDASRGLKPIEGAAEKPPEKDVSAPLVPNRQKYEDAQSFDLEIVQARKVYSDFRGSVEKLFGDAQMSRELDLKSMIESVDGIVQSIVSNPDACLLLQQMQVKDDYLYNHAMGTSIWAAAFARQLGMPQEGIKSACMTALLCDVGMMSVPDDVRLKEGRLIPEDYELVKGHVDQSLNYVSDMRGGLHKSVIRAIKHHHERFDGSGYPDGLVGTSIPLLARVVGISDTYEAMISDRVYAKAKSPAEAVRELYDLKDKHFQPELVDEFIQTVGIYPVGSQVEITTGEVGVVIAEYRHRRLRPRLLIIADAEKNELDDTYYLDLGSETHTHDGKPIEILRSLELGAYGLEVDDIFI